MLYFTSARDKDWTGPWSSEHKGISKRPTSKNICVINQLNRTPPSSWALCALTSEKFSLFHQTQFRTLRHSSALWIFCVKLYFQSFMSNLNSWQLHSDLDRIPNLPWTPNPFHEKHTAISKHTLELDLLSLKLNYSQEFSMFACWPEL